MNGLAWNYIKADPVAIQAAPTSVEALGGLGERLKQFGEAAYRAEANRAAEAKLEALRGVGGNQIQPEMTSPTGMVNQSVNLPVPVTGNGLAAVPKVSGKAPVQAAQPYISMFQEASKQYNVPMPVLLAVAQTESNFNPEAVSQTGVKGLMQVTQNTYNGLGMTGDRSDPRNSIMAGAKLLSQNYNKYKNWDDAFLAYNGGHNGVTGYRQGNWGTWANNIAKQKEISNYVTKVNGYLNNWRDIYG